MGKSSRHGGGVGAEWSRAWSRGALMTVTGAAGAAGTEDSGDVSGLGKCGAAGITMCRWWD